MSYFTRFQLHRLVVGYVMLLCVATTILAVNTSSTRTINVAAAGKLSTLLPEADRQYVENLTLTGKLNGTDFKILRAMATDQNLQTLDLSGASIVSGGDPYYTVSSTGSKYYTSNNEAGYCLFGSCKKLQKVVLPNSLITLGSGVFYGCSDLRTMVIGSKVTSIGSGLFWRCTQLSSVQINNNSNFHLANGILYNKDYSFVIAAIPTYNFGNLTFRSSVKYIQTSAFACCSKLTSVTIPTSVTEIMSYVFAETGISSVTFSSSITRIYSDAFEGCKNLKQVDLRPTKITSLDWGAFDNSNIEVVYLPKTLTELKEYTFARNPLKHIFAYTATPATMFDFSSNYASFKNVDTNTCVVHVPTGKVSTYKAAAGWKEFQYITDSQEIESVKEAYAVYTDNGTLTFYYDNQKDSRSGTKYGLTTASYQTPGWYKDHRTDIKKAVFTSSFANARPTTTNWWFAIQYSDNKSNLSEIEGIQYLNTSNVTTMYRMFFGCSNLTKLDVSNFDTKNVTTMGGMFYGCRGLTNLDVKHFNTSKVTSMREMFGGCGGLLSIDLSNFETSKVTDMSYMFYGCRSLMDLDVSHFNTSNVTNMSSMFSGCNSLTNFDVSHFNTSNVTNMSSMFSGCNSLTNLDVSNFNTSNVTSMEDMFYGCSSLTSLDVSHFNTGNVTNMKCMFTDCNALTSLDVSHFNTGIVTKMSWMFSGCSGLIGLDVSHFDTRNVTDMYEMFCHCSSLTYLDVSHFDTSSVISMKGMFSGCSGLTGLDLSSFNTSNVTSMENMFSGCSGLTILDLSSFDMSNVTNIGYMFGGCSGLTTIYVEDNNWNIKKVTFYGHMFKGCTKLVGGAGTRYFNSELYVHGDYAHIDGGPSNPGYLTDINALKVQEKVCDSDDLLNALLALEGNGTGTEDNHATLAPCDSGLAVDNDVDIDDDLYIDLVGKKPDGSKSDMVFSGSSINVMTGSMVRMSQFVMKSDGNGGGISNSGNLTFSDCELQDGDYTVENLSGSTMTLNDNTIAGSGIIVNCGNLYVDGSCTVNGLKNKAGGCIFLTSTPMTYIRIILDEVTVESLGVPVIAGADGYILTETDANALTIDVPDGYEWYYDADMQAVCIRTSTAIEDVRNNKTRVAEGYDTSGRKVSDKYRGLRILRMNDGSVKKNVKKN